MRRCRREGAEHTPGGHVPDARGHASVSAQRERAPPPDGWPAHAPPQGETIECLKFNLPPVRQLVILARNREQRFKAANRDVNVFSSSLSYQPDHAGHTAPGSGHQPGI